MGHGVVGYAKAPPSSSNRSARTLRCRSSAQRGAPALRGTASRAFRGGDPAGTSFLFQTFRAARTRSTRIRRSLQPCRRLFQIFQPFALSTQFITKSTVNEEQIIATAFLPYPNRILKFTQARLMHAIRATPITRSKQTHANVPRSRRRSSRAPVARINRG